MKQSDGSVIIIRKNRYWNLEPLPLLLPPEPENPQQPLSLKSLVHPFNVFALQGRMVTTDLTTEGPTEASLPQSKSPKKIFLRKTPVRKAKTSLVVLRKPQDGMNLKKVASKTEELNMKTSNFDPTTDMLDHTFLGTQVRLTHQQAGGFLRCRALVYIFIAFCCRRVYFDCS